MKNLEFLGLSQALLAVCVLLTHQHVQRTVDTLAKIDPGFPKMTRYGNVLVYCVPYYVIIFFFQHILVYIILCFKFQMLVIYAIIGVYFGFFHE